MFVAVPLDEALVREGVQIALAIKLFEEEVISVGKAARLAGLPLETFIEKLGAAKIPVVRYDPEELDGELAQIQQLSRR